MTFGNVVDKLHDQHGLTYTSTTKQTDLSTLHVRLEQVDDLNTGRKNFLVSRELFELRSLTMDRVSTLHFKLLHAVDRLTDYIQHSAFDLLACRHNNRTACWDSLQATLQTVGVIHSYATYGVLTDMLLDLNNKVTAVWTLYLQSLINLRKHLFRIFALGLEINIDNRADDLGDASVNL